MAATTALVCLALAAAACGGGGGSSDASSSKSSGAGPTGGASKEAVATYGYGPKPAPGVDYQSDVVMIPAGPAAVISATTDGIVWTLDRKAAGVSDLKVGKVMLATSRATGRVAAITDKGDTRVVTLAPINITDVVKNGDINFSQALTPANVSSVQYLDAPAAQSSPPDSDFGGAAITLAGAPRITTVAAPSFCLCDKSKGDIPPAGKGSVSIPAGDYTVTPGFSPGALTLDVERKGALKLALHLQFGVSTLSVDSAMSIKDGLVGGTTFVINGINGLGITMSAGAAGGSADNEKIRVELPMDFSFPIPPSPATAGLPLLIKFGFTYSIETAITGNNSTIVAAGEYGLDGPIGVRGGNFLSPKFSVKQSIIDSLQGITLGPSGIVFAVKLKVQSALGIPSLSAGPYGSFTTSIGVTNGSSLGASLARCKSATLDFKVGGGASVNYSSSVLDILSKFFPPGTSLPEIKVDKNVQVLHRSQIVPDVPLCDAGLGGGGANSGGGGSGGGGGAKGGGSAA